MPRAVVLQHVQHEGCGRLAALLVARGLARDERHLYAGDAVPSASEPCALLVVMGGPMGVGDIGAARYPFLAREAQLLQARVRADLPTLGICLGAQLIAHAAGAQVQPNVRSRVPGGAPERVLEVGWGPVAFAVDGGDPALRGIGPHEVMLHWHGDNFDLPAGAAPLGSTPLCPHQGFRLGRNVYALQFHCEVDIASVRTWVADDAEYVVQANGSEGGPRILADTDTFMPRHREIGDRLLGNILDAMGFAPISP